MSQARELDAESSIMTASFSDRRSLPDRRVRPSTLNFRSRSSASASWRAVVATYSGCHSAPKLPDKSSKEYGDVVSAFYVGLAALQVGDDVHAESRLSEVTRLVPAEPAGWANWGILALRQRNYDAAAQRLERARDLAPKNDQIYDLLGILESQRGNSAQAIADLRKAAELNPQNLRAIYQLAEETERQGGANSEAEFQQLMQKILAAQPDNLAALLELSRIAAKRGDAATLKSAVAQISARSSAWPPEVQHQLAAVQSAAAGSDLRPAATQTTFLRNVLVRVPEYRQSLTAIKARAGRRGRALHPLPAAGVAGLQAGAGGHRAHLQSSADRQSWRAVAGIGSERFRWAVRARRPSPWQMAAKCVCPPARRFPSPAERPACRRCPKELCRSISITTSKPIWCWPARAECVCCAQDSPSSFHDVTAQAKLPKSVTNAPYTGAWAVDIEADGDLDIVLGASRRRPDGFAKQRRWHIPADSSLRRNFRRARLCLG